MEAVLARNNLFHGHFVENGSAEPNVETTDFLIVFHAFEYPVDLEPVKAQYAQRIDRNAIPFTSTDRVYGFRNALYSFKLDRLWILDFQNAPPSANGFANLLSDTASPALVADQENIAGGAAGWLFDLNAFPTECPRIFT